MNDKFNEVVAQAGVFSDFCEFINIAVSNISFEPGSIGAERYKSIYIPATMQIIAEESRRIWDNFGELQEALTETKGGVSQ